MEKHPHPVLLLLSELWLLISYHLPIPTRKNLAEVSKHFHRIWIPLLYQSVDLSVHHFQSTTDEDNFIVKRWRDNLQEILGRQSLFMRQLLQSPLEMTLPRLFGIVPPQWQYRELDIHKECAWFIQSVKPPVLALRYLCLCPDQTRAPQIHSQIRTSVMPPNKVFGFDASFWPLLSEGWSDLKEIHLSNVYPNGRPLPQGVSDKDVLRQPNLQNLDSGGR